LTENMNYPVRSQRFMSYRALIKKKWEELWMPKLQEGKTKVELERDREYETKWVWYHTVLAVELFACNVFLLWIAIVLTVN